MITQAAQAGRTAEVQSLSARMQQEIQALISESTQNFTAGGTSNQGQSAGDAVEEESISERSEYIEDDEDVDPEFTDEEDILSEEEE